MGRIYTHEERQQLKEYFKNNPNKSRAEMSITMARKLGRTAIGVESLYAKMVADGSIWRDDVAEGPRVSKK